VRVLGGDSAHKRWLALAGGLISVRSVVETHTAPYGAEFGRKAPNGAVHASPPKPIR
jgi:hypothetical protein